MYSFSERSVWIESSNDNVPWTYEGGIVTINPDEEGTRYQVLSADDKIIETEDPATRTKHTWIRSL